MHIWCCLVIPPPSIIHQARKEEKTFSFSWWWIDGRIRHAELRLQPAITRESSTGSLICDFHARLRGSNEIFLACREQLCFSWKSLGVNYNHTKTLITQSLLCCFIASRISVLKFSACDSNVPCVVSRFSSMCLTAMKTLRCCTQAKINWDLARTNATRWTIKV